MEPVAVWAEPDYFIATSLLEGVALNWRKREHDAERPLLVLFFQESKAANRVVCTVQMEDLYIVVFVSGLGREH